MGFQVLLWSILGRTESFWNPDLQCKISAICVWKTAHFFQIRNISRSIWINVAHQPEGAPPPGIKGKTIASDITPQQLRRRKIEALYLALSFAFAASHYLREEDGLQWEDYKGVLPAFIYKYDEANSHNDSMTASYSATADSTLGKKREDNRSGRNSPDNATKRVRPKRSKVDVSGAATPLLNSAYTVVDFRCSPATYSSMPLPLMWVFVFIYSGVELMDYLSSIAHHLSKAIFKFRREGLLETVGPAGMPFYQVGTINIKTFLPYRCQCTDRHVCTGYSSVQFWS